jgi:hypothetical protein
MDFTGTSPGWNGLYWNFTGLLRNEGTKFTGLEWILLELHRAGLDFTRDSPGCNGFYWRFTGLLRNEESSPGWNGFYWNFTGLEWILLEIHRAGMTFTGNALADMNLLEGSPGCYGFFVEIHRAGTDPTSRFTGL